LQQRIKEKSPVMAGGKSPLGPPPLLHLRQRWLQVPPVTFRAHPALGTGDTLELPGFEDQELMGLACVPEHSNSIFAVLKGADATDSPVANLNAVTNRKSARHLSLVNFFSQSIASEATIKLVN
jgi:hypothetical protein